VVGLTTGKRRFEMAKRIAAMVLSSNGNVADIVKLVRLAGLRGSAAQAVADRALLYMLEGV
jgi:hypothetical protein